MDFALETTFDYKFTTRAFATGIPTTLAGTPVVDVYEDNSLTQITAAETLTVDFDGVTGLNNLRIAATGANGFESGKSYAAVITTGTVDRVSVVGEVVCNFTIQRSPVNWGNVTGATTAVDLSGTDIQLCDTITTYTGNTVQTGDAFARLGAPAGASVSADIADVPTVAEFEARTLVAASYFDPAADTVANVTTVATTTTNTDMRGTDSAALASNVPDSLSHANLQAQLITTYGLDHLLSAAVVGTDVTDNSVFARLVSASATADWDDFVNTTDSLQAVRDRGDAAWATATGFSTHSAADVWTSATRTVSAATNITSDGAAINTTSGVVDTVTNVTTVNALATAAITDVWSTDTLTESYAADGAAGTPAQLLYLIQQHLTEFSISGTTWTTKKLDGSTTAATFTLDDSTSPTSLTRAT